MPKSKKRRKAGPARPRVPMGNLPQMVPVFTRPGFELLPEAAYGFLGGPEHADHVEQLRPFVQDPNVLFIPFDTLRVLDLVDTLEGHPFEAVLNQYAQVHLTQDDFLTWQSSPEELVLVVEKHLGVSSDAPLASSLEDDTRQNDILQAVLLEIATVVPQEDALRSLAQAAGTLMRVAERSEGTLGPIHLVGEWPGGSVSYVTDPAAPDEDLDAGRATGILARLLLGEGHVVTLCAEDRSTAFGTRSILAARAWWVVDGGLEPLTAEQARRLKVDLPESAECVDAFDVSEG